MRNAAANPSERTSPGIVALERDQLVADAGAGNSARRVHATMAHMSVISMLLLTRPR